jgi:hypothetical protein
MASDCARWTPETTGPIWCKLSPGLPVMRILAACVFALFATCAVAENLVLKDARIQYIYTSNTLGSRHFCDLATTMSKVPMVIKLTAAFVTDDAKPEDNNLTVAYIVEAFVIGPGKNGKLEPHEVKVVAGRIISDIFNSDLHATKNVDKDLGASYNIPSEGSLSLFMNVMTIRGAYQLAVDFENNSSLIVDVKPTPQILDAGEKWNKCSIALMEHRTPP